MAELQWLTPHAADPYIFLVVVCRSCMSITGTVCFVVPFVRAYRGPGTKKRCKKEERKQGTNYPKSSNNDTYNITLGFIFGMHLGFKIDVWEVREAFGTTWDTTWDSRGHLGPKKNEKVSLRRPPRDQVGTLNHQCRSQLELQVHVQTFFVRSFFKAYFGVDL